MTIENENLDRGDELHDSLDPAPPGDEAPETPETPPETPEGEEEGAETEEERAERERREAEEAKKRNIRIPKARFDEAQAKARAREQALLEEIERLKGTRQASETQTAVSEARAKLEEMQDKYEDLIIDGQKDEARKMRRQIDKLRDELVEYQTSVKSEAARRGAIDELTYNAQLANFESQYAVLNPDSDEFDQDTTEEVAAVMKALANSGKSRADALAKAVRYVLGAPPQQQASDAGRALAEQRAKKAREKAAAAISAQPPSMSGVGADSDKAGRAAAGETAGVDIMRMSQERFAKLDEETKARMRGDEV